MLPKGHPGFRIWDTACPPDLRLCNFYPPQLIVSGRLRTVSLSNITGLTFFCKGERIYGIHGHTSILPSARQEYENLPERLRKHVVWTYVPMEGIKGLGLLGPAALVVSAPRLHQRQVLTGDRLKSIEQRFASGNRL